MTKEKANSASLLKKLGFVGNMLIVLLLAYFGLRSMNVASHLLSFDMPSTKVAGRPELPVLDPGDLEGRWFFAGFDWQVVMNSSSSNIEDQSPGVLLSGDTKELLENLVAYAGFESTTDGNRTTYTLDSEGVSLAFMSTTVDERSYAKRLDLQFQTGSETRAIKLVPANNDYQNHVLKQMFPAGNIRPIAMRTSDAGELQFMVATAASDRQWLAQLTKDNWKITPQFSEENSKIVDGSTPNSPSIISRYRIQKDSARYQLTEEFGPNQSMLFLVREIQ